MTIKYNVYETLYFIVMSDVFNQFTLFVHRFLFVTEVRHFIKVYIMLPFLKKINNPTVSFTVLSGACEVWLKLLFLVGFLIFVLTDNP